MKTFTVTDNRKSYHIPIYDFIAFNRMDSVSASFLSAVLSKYDIAARGRQEITVCEVQSVPDLKVPPLIVMQHFIFMFSISKSHLIQRPLFISFDALPGRKYKVIPNPELRPLFRDMIEYSKEYDLCTALSMTNKYGVRLFKLFQDRVPAACPEIDVVATIGELREALGCTSDTHLLKAQFKSEVLKPASKSVCEQAGWFNEVVFCKDRNGDDSRCHIHIKRPFDIFEYGHVYGSGAVFG